MGEMQAAAKLIDLGGKTAAVLGVADESSIAWGIACAFAGHGASVHIGYQQRYFSRVRLLLRGQPAIHGDRCDVSAPGEMEAFFSRFREQHLDVVVHAISHAPAEVFTKPVSEVSSSAFAETLDVSAGSLARVVQCAKPYLREWASVIAITSGASVCAWPFNGMMGVAKAALESLVRYLALELGERSIRVNAISPAPVNTLGAVGETLGILRAPDSPGRQSPEAWRKVFTQAAREVDPALDEFAFAKTAWSCIQWEFAQKSAMAEEIITKEDVSGSALFLASDLSRMITGQVLHVDGGISSTLIV